MLAGGGRLVVVGAVDGSGALGTGQWSAPELPRWSEAASADRHGDLEFWVHSKWAEVGEGVLCPLDQLKGTDELLEVR